MVNFGERLRDELRREGWESHYIQYGTLKKVLKKIARQEQSGHFSRSGQLRKEFKIVLVADIARIDAFFKDKLRPLVGDAARLSRSIEDCLNTTDADVRLFDLKSTTSFEEAIELPVQDENRFGETKEYHRDGAAGVLDVVEVVLEEVQDDGRRRRRRRREEGFGAHDEVAVPNNPTATTTATTATTTTTTTPAPAPTLPPPTSPSSTPEVAFLIDLESGSFDDSSLLPPPSKSALARAAVDALVAFRREVGALVKYAYVNKEAVRKIVKKHDKNLTTVMDQPIGDEMELLLAEETAFGVADSSTKILLLFQVIEQLKRKIQMKSMEFSRYYATLQQGNEEEGGPGGNGYNGGGGEGYRSGGGGKDAEGGHRRKKGSRHPKEGSLLRGASNPAGTEDWSMDCCCGECYGLFRYFLWVVPVLFTFYLVYSILLSY